MAAPLSFSDSSITHAPSSATANIGIGDTVIDFGSLFGSAAGKNPLYYVALGAITIVAVSYLRRGK